MSIALSGLWSEVVFHAIATIEEFANITTYVLLQNKFAARVVELEVFNVDHQMIQNHILGSELYLLEEIHSFHAFKSRNKWGLLSQPDLV